MLIFINKIKVLVLIFNISLFITPFLANAQNKDRYLSLDDIKIYKNGKYKEPLFISESSSNNENINIKPEQLEINTIYLVKIYI